MAADPNGFPQRAQDLLARLTPIQKIALGAATLTLVAGALFLSRTGGPGDMAPLYTDLASADAGAVIDELSARGVAYQLTDAGRTILVPQDDVYDLRITMSTQGLPSSNDGYALLDRQGITTSEFRQRVDYQRALEGEIARTIRAMDGITTATVHLVLPEESVFVDTPSQATASVMVAARTAQGLGDDQVDAIIHLVSSSVKNLAPGDVTVISSEGTVLSAPGRVSGGSGGGTARAKAEAAFERDLASSITGMLTRVTGPGKVAVTVSADLDLSQRQSTSESFANVAGEEGETGAVVAERTSNETFTGAGGGATGILGPDGAQLVPEIGVGENASEYERDDAERTFALDRTVQQVTEATGGIERISVAVLVDEGAVDAAQMAQIQDMVIAAAGIEAARGDTVVITRLPFNTAASEAAEVAAAEAAAAAAEAERMTLIRTLAIVALALVALLLAFFSARRARKVVTTPIDIGEISATRMQDALPVSQLLSNHQLDVADEEGEDGSEEMLELEAAEISPAASDLMMAEISALAEERPEEVASILKTWLAESQGGR